MSNILNGITEAKRSPEPNYDDPSWDEKVSNVGQKAKQSEVLKSKGKEPKTRWNPETKKYYVDFSDDDVKKESVGIPYPGTYEQTNDMFKSSGQKRIGTLTTEQGVAEVFADQGSGSTARDNAEYMKRRNAAGSEIKIPTEDGITMQDIRLMAGEGPLTKKTVLQAIAVIRKQRREQGVAEGSVDHRELGKHHEEMTDQELRKVGSKLPDAWDAAVFRRKLASHPKYAQALKHYDKSEYHFGKAARQGVAEALTYPQKHSSWSVHSPKKNEFNTRYNLDQEPEARVHAERIGGKLVKVDQRGHAIRTGSKGDKGVAEGFGAPALAGTGDQSVTIIGGPEMYVGKSGWLGKMSPHQAQKYPGYVLVHLNHGGGSTLLPKAAVKIEQGVAEGSLEEVSQDTARSYAQKAQASQKDLINQTHRKGADTDALNKKIKNRQQGMDRAHTDKRYYKDEQGVDEEKQRLDPHCWTDKHKEGTKMKGGVRVNNCVPNESAIMKGIKV